MCRLRHVLTCSLFLRSDQLPWENTRRKVSCPSFYPPPSRKFLLRCEGGELEHPNLLIARNLTPRYIRPSQMPTRFSTLTFSCPQILLKVSFNFFILTLHNIQSRGSSNNIPKHRNHDPTDQWHETSCPSPQPGNLPFHRKLAPFLLSPPNAVLLRYTTHDHDADSV